MTYTMKTSGEQIEKVLGEIHSYNLREDNGNLGVTNIEGVNIGEFYKKLTDNNIDPDHVGIDNIWGHLTIWFTNWDGTYPQYGKHKVVVTDIEWDCETEDANLPTELAITIYESDGNTDDAISEFLCENYGYCAKSFAVTDI